MDIQITHHLLVSALVKPAIMLAVLTVVFWLLRKCSAALRHFVLLLGISGLLAMPLLGSLALALGIKLPALLTGLSLALDRYWALWLPTVNRWLYDYGLWLFALYSLVACSLLYYRFLGWLLLAYKTRRSPPVSDAALCLLRDQLCELLDIARPVQLRTGKWVLSAQVWGHWRPVILLPRSAHLWTPEQQLAVLMHELGHVARRDWLASQWVALVCALFWFLPPLWWLAARLYDQAEIACDDMVYRLGKAPADYAQSLLHFAKGAHAREDSALGMAGHSDIYQRIQAILDNRRSHQPVAVEAQQYWFSSAAVLLLALAAIQVWPVASLQRAVPQQWINIALPPAEPVPTELGARIDWQQVARLRPAAAPEPWPQQTNRVEEMRVIARPAVELASLALGEWDDEAPMPRPRIRVQGYLPLHLQVPEYPAMALTRGLEGRVVVQFTIDPLGHIQDPVIIERPGSRIFDKAVLAALKKSRYQPQTLDGEPVALQGVTEEFVFQLQTHPPRRP